MPLPSWGGFSFPLALPFASAIGRTGQAGTSPARIEAGAQRSRAASLPVTVDVLGQTRAGAASVTVDVSGRTRASPLPVNVGLRLGGIEFPLRWPVECRPGTAGPAQVVVGVPRTRTGAVFATIALLTGAPDATLLLWDAIDTHAYGLPPSFAIEGQRVEAARPVLTLPGALAALPAGARRARPRIISIAGTIAGATPGDAEQLAREIRGALFGRGQLVLERLSVPGRILRIRVVRVATDMHRGRFGGALRTLTIEAEASDPFWYAVTPHAASLAASASGQSWTVTNPGTVPRQPVVVRFTARTGAVINPTLTNQRTGQVVQYLGTLAPGESVVLDARSRTATKGGANALPAVNAEWHAQGFSLDPGENVLLYTDDPASSHACDVSIEWYPAWW